MGTGVPLAALGAHLFQHALEEVAIGYQAEGGWHSNNGISEKKKTNRESL
jgi:hypothetical protein